MCYHGETRQVFKDIHARFIATPGAAAELAAITVGYYDPRHDEIEEKLVAKAKQLGYDRWYINQDERGYLREAVALDELDAKPTAKKPSFLKRVKVGKS